MSSGSREVGLKSLCLGIELITLPSISPENVLPSLNVSVAVFVLNSMILICIRCVQSMPAGSVPSE